MVLLLSAGAFAQTGPTEYNLKSGDQFKVAVTIKQNIDQTMLGQVMKTTQTINTVDLYEVVSVTEASYLLKTTGLSRSLLTETPQGSVSIDSDLDGDDHLAFRALTGKSYYAEMNKYGRLLRFSGLEELKKAVEDDLEGTMLQGSADQLMLAFDPETLGTAFDGQFYIYQEPGKSWNRDSEMVVNNLPISVSYDFSRSATNEITAKGAMVLTGEIEAMGQTVTAEMTGDQTSIFKLDPVTGLSKSIRTTQDMDGALEVQDISVPMVLKTIVEVVITR